ncbi:MAG: primosomal protein N', partial [Patescibacteria group bacterium]|nr:primosomal protein N' [Patescibacteria group bacterium]
MTYVDVIVYAKYTGRRYYTYKTGLNLSIGSVVKAPYGKSSYPGIVMNIVKKPTIDIKDIDTIYDFNLPNQSVELLKWLCSYYPFDYGEICGLFIPPNLTVKPRVQKDTPFTSFESKEPFMLNKEQLLAVNAIVNNAHSILHGDTGTGKTETYLEVAKQMINAGKSVLIITPEIGLTPQLLASVTNRLKCPVYITNSQMTPAKRKQTWIAAYNNTSPSVYIGPRSSIFLPYQNLGLIVADESHDLSYYNQQNPRYNGLFVASQLAKIHKAHFVQSSATPNISDYYYCQKLKLPIIRMTKMAVGDPNVRGEVIDMTDKQNLSPYQQLSNKLLKELDSNLNNNMQSMLFINRRGTARIIQCQNCGHISQCPTCNLPLTYHHDQYKNKCHQCGYQESTQTQCSQCNSPELSYKTPGTKGTVSDIQKLFPSAKIARFDLDVQHSQSLKEQFENIKDGKFDII